jgi:hypothetical protein
MAPAQDWCLQCGAPVSGSIGAGGWRPAATLLTATLVLVLAAAAVGYAALNKKSRKPVAATTTLAQTPAPAQAPAPAQTPATPVTPGTPTTIKPALPHTSSVKLPKIPLPTATPAPTPVPAFPTPTVKIKGGAAPPKSSTGGSGAAEKQPPAIMLDTNAASTYNPYDYPAAAFGDPSLTIDGDTSTGWSAQVDPATAPKMAEGVLIDLKSAMKIASVKLVTPTPGMTVQVYGSNARKAPASITDKTWVPLSPSFAFAKKHARIKLRHTNKPFRFFTLWISHAPAASVGTPQAPGHVSVNELELFPAG